MNLKKKSIADIQKVNVKKLNEDYFGNYVFVSCLNDVGLPAGLVLFSVFTLPTCVKREDYCHFDRAAVLCFYM